MDPKKRPIVSGIVLLSIGVALLVSYLTGEGNYWGPIILLGVGLGLVLKTLIDEKDREKRKTPVAGIILIVLGAISLLDIMIDSNIVGAAIRGLAPYVLPVLLIALGIKLLFK